MNPLNRISEIPAEEEKEDEENTRKSRLKSEDSVDSKSPPDIEVETLGSKKKAFAVKIVRDNDPEKLLAHEMEFKIMKNLDHANVVRAVEIFRDDFKNEIYQVMQYIEGSEILDEIAQMGKYDEKDAQKIYKQLLEGIAYLHAKGVAHRDIKPSNILITKEMKVYITDFNVAKKGAETPKEGDNTSLTMYTKSAGTVAFAAPERLKQSNATYTEKVDMWSAGIVLIMLLTG